MSHASFLPPCRATSERAGSTPLVRTAGVRSLRAVTVLPQRIRLADYVRFLRYGISHTADADALRHPDCSRPVRSVLSGSRDSGPRHSRPDHTARTMGSRTGMRGECAAKQARTRLFQVSCVACSPAAGVPCSGPLPSTRGILVSGTGYGAYAAWGASGGTTGGSIGVPSGWRGVRSIAVRRPACRMC